MSFWSRAAPPPPAQPPTVDLKCSFCGKSQRDVKKLVAGPEVYICDECVDLSATVIREESPPPLVVPTIGSLIADLGRRVFGQDAAIRAVAAVLVHHLHLRDVDDYRAPRLLLAGPPGCGKTALLAAACRAIPGLASYHADAGRITESGYVGEDVENIVGGLAARAPTLSDAVRGLLGLDGIHHLAPHAPDGKTTRDVAGREAQRDLVRLLDGTELAAIRGGPLHPQASYEHVRADRIAVLASVTTAASATDERQLRRALAAEGLLNETLTRFDTVVVMQPLGEAALASVARDRVGRELASITGAKLRITDDGLAALVALAVGSGDGAWGLGPPLARIREHLWLEPGRELVVDERRVSTLSVAR